MRFKSNIDLKITIDYMKILSLSNFSKNNAHAHAKIVEICDRHPKNEKMMFFKIRSLKKLNKTYKTIEAIDELIKINPYNKKILFEIAKLIT
jgi:hypothetical protein